MSVFLSPGFVVEVDLGFKSAGESYTSAPPQLEPAPAVQPKQ